MKLKLMIRLLLLAGLVSGFAPVAQAFYNPSAGRWLSRDPIEEKGGVNPYRFVANAPLINLDPDGRRTWVPFPFPGHWVDDPQPPPPPPAIDCSGYKKLFSTTCTDCSGASKNDLYPKRANAVCKGFAKMFTGDSQQAEASCVANCLIAAEAKIQAAYKDCDTRNCARLMAHVKCYAKCNFTPNPLNLPPGADVVGWGDLLPPCIRGAVILAPIGVF